MLLGGFVIKTSGFCFGYAWVGHFIFIFIFVVMVICSNYLNVFRMVMRGEIPYIRITREIPQEMREKLPQGYITALETKVLFQCQISVSNC